MEVFLSVTYKATDNPLVVKRLACCSSVLWESSVLLHFTCPLVGLILSIRIHCIYIHTYVYEIEVF